MGAIDRQKHDIDIVERVLGHGDDDDEVRGRAGRIEIINIDVRPGFVTSTVSASQVMIGGLAPPDEPTDE